MESVWPVSKLSTESVGSRRELVANCVHTADATQLDSFVASALAVCIGHKQTIRCTYPTRNCGKAIGFTRKLFIDRTHV